MDNKQLSEKILTLIGGRENVVSLTHCSTRLRFVLVDNDKVAISDLKKVPGVLDVVNKAQFQIIIGSHVNEVYDYLTAMVGNGNNAKGNTKKQGLFSQVLDFFVSVFQPLIPAMAGAGILKSLLFLFVMLGWMTNQDTVFLTLRYISDSIFYFLPLLIAFTTATKLKANPLAAVSLVSILLFPEMIKLLEGGATFLSFEMANINYASQVFPALFAVVFYAYVERFFTRFSPKTIRVFFVTMMSYLVTVPIMLLLIGPFGFQLGVWMTSFILAVYEFSGFIGLGLLAAALPFLIATGMHKALTPYAISSLSSLGKEILMLPALLIHNLSQSGAAFAVSLRTKDPDKKAIAISGGVSAFFGISEPALYGVTLPNKRVLRNVVISCLIGGLFVGWVGLAGFTLVTPGLASISLFIDPENSMNFVYAIIGFILAFTTSFLLNFFTWKDTEEEKSKTELKRAELEVASTTKEKIALTQPIEGTLVPLSEVNDEIFSNKVMGDGIAVIPSKGELRAPADGTVKMVFNTKHALGLELNNGSELLFHIGLDTVQLGGKHFTSHVEPGASVKTGELLISFDLDAIIEEGFDPVTIVVVTTDKEQAKVEVSSTTTDIYPMYVTTT